MRVSRAGWTAIWMTLLLLPTSALIAEAGVFQLFPDSLSRECSFSPGQPDSSLSLRIGYLIGPSSGSSVEPALFRCRWSSANLEASSAGVSGTGPGMSAAPASGNARLDAGILRQRLFDRKTLRLTTGVFVALPLVGYLTWWQKEEHTAFHFDSEGWFGKETYAGGADKVSHIFFSYAVCRELTAAYESFGHPPSQARSLAVGVTVLGGLLVEVGDGMTTYGFSWEDAASNVIGALTAAEISRRGWDGLVGLRMGFVRARIPGPDNRAYGYGSDYSREIYSADLKLGGALRRLGIRPGIARFLLLSVTYGSKGYRFSPVDRHERNVGIDLGVNLPEVLSALGVPESSWWGKPLWKFLTYYRLAYSAFGYRYDLNHHRWHGPDTGDRFDPGAVIYR